MTPEEYTCVPVAPTNSDMRKKMNSKIASRFASTWVFLCLIPLQIVQGFPQQGKWKLKLNDSDIGQYNGVAKNLYKDTKLFKESAILH